jgi:hypothetical protein
MKKRMCELSPEQQEQRRAYNKQYREDNKEKCLASSRKYQKKVYVPRGTPQGRPQLGPRVEVIDKLRAKIEHHSSMVLSLQEKQNKLQAELDESTD